MPINKPQSNEVGDLGGSARTFGIYRNPAAHSNNVAVSDVGRIFVPDIANEGLGGTFAGAGEDGVLGNVMLPNDQAAANRQCFVCLDEGKDPGEKILLESIGVLDVLVSGAVLVDADLEVTFANTANERGTLITAAGGGGAAIVARALEAKTGSAATPVLCRVQFFGYMAPIAVRQ